MLPRDNNDSRKRYTHQAYDVSYFGKSPETGPSGYNTRLSGSHTSLITFPVDMGAAGAVLIGDMTSGLTTLALVNHAALTGGTVTLSMPAFGGEPAIDFPAIDVSAASVIFTGVDVGLPPLTIDRPLTATAALGTQGETASISLMVCAVETAWK